MPERFELDDLARRLAAASGGRRMIVAIAGPPGAGKSTIAERLAAAIAPLVAGGTAVVPMDGFHLDDGLLEARGLRHRKGAPETFDVAGLAACLRRLADNREEEVLVPVFDRSLEIARAGARAVPKSVAIVLVEGNYLLLDREPWRRLAEIFDFSVMLDCPEAELERRLMARWLGYGLAPEEARRKLETNDVPNGRAVREESRPADAVLGLAG